MEVLLGDIKKEIIKNHRYSILNKSKMVIFLLLSLMVITTLFAVSNTEKEKKSVTNIICEIDPAKLARMRVIEANDLFLSSTNGGKLNYILSDLVGRGYSSTGWSWDADFFDFDNDGDLDIVLNNYHGPAKVYRNNS